MQRIFLFTLLVFVCTLPSTAQNATSFSYTLSSSSRTSAGVFDSTGALIRTLWSNRSQPASTYTQDWDGKDDDGAIAPASASYTLKVLANNVTYTWDGVIGNTENAWTTSTSIWDQVAYSPLTLRMTFVNSGIWAAAGYSEGTANLIYINPASPNSPRPANNLYTSQNVAFMGIDNDGTFMYLSNAGAWSGQNFVTKFDAATAVPATFSSGETITGQLAWPKISMSAIALNTVHAPDAVAVQNDGPLLAVAYPTASTINFFNKVTGESYGTALSIASPTSMGFTRAGLWVISGSMVYLVKDPGGANTLTSPLPDLSHPLFLTTNKKNNHVYLLDGGASQQAKEFDLSNKLVRSYGKQGGYTDFNPTVTNTKLLLDATATKGTPAPLGAWIAVSPTNEWWICDAGNAGRILHISPSNAYIDQIQFQPETYTVGIGQSAPTRLFRGTIEYAIDYTRPLLPGDPSSASGNGSWKMVRNWSVGGEGANGSPAGNYGPLPQFGIQNVELLGNGHYYGHLMTREKTLYEVELPTSGTAPLRFIKTLFSAGEGDRTPLQPDGSLTKETISGSPTNRVLTIARSSLTGFDSSFNPVRTPFTIVTAIPYTTSTAPNAGGGWGQLSPNQSTTTGVYPIYQSYSTGKAGFPHLAGAVAGRSSFLWKTHREKAMTLSDGVGSFPGTAGYGGHAGIAAQAVGRNIFASYDGQYATWGNQNFHYWDDGLMIGQFGVPEVARPRVPPPPYSIPLPTGNAGNIAQTRFVPYGGDIYMYMTAESGFTPVQRWHITNLSSIFELSASATVGSSVTLHQVAPSK